MTHTELWLQVKGYEGFYEVSNTGKIRSIDRIVNRSDTGYSLKYSGQIIKQTLDKRGYENVYLSINSKSKRYRVHRLVAMAFLDNPENKPQVNHKDGNKQNNHVNNLEWSTDEENRNHAIENGLYTKNGFGDKSFSFTGSVKAFKDGVLIATMNGNEEMKKNGFDYRLVSAVLKGKRKSHMGCTFEKMKRDTDE